MSRAAEFVGMVVVPFILDDFKQFFVSLPHSSQRHHPPVHPSLPRGSTSLVYGGCGADVYIS